MADPLSISDDLEGKRSDDEAMNIQSNEAKRKRTELEEMEENADEDDPWAQKRQKKEDHPESKGPYYLSIVGYTRPFPLATLKNDLLGNHLTFWLNSIKSASLTSYNTDFERGEVLETMNNRVWPDEPKRKKLEARKLTKEEAEVFQSTDGKQTNLENEDSKPEEKEGDELNKLFRLTKTEPKLYYLPLTEEQIRQKQEARNRRVATR